MNKKFRFKTAEQPCGSQIEVFNQNRRSKKRQSSKLNFSASIKLKRLAKNKMKKLALKFFSLNLKILSATFQQTPSTVIIANHRT